MPVPQGFPPQSITSPFPLRYEHSQPAPRSMPVGQGSYRCDSYSFDVGQRSAISDCATRALGGLIEAGRTAAYLVKGVYSTCMIGISMVIVGAIITVAAPLTVVGGLLGALGGLVIGLPVARPIACMQGGAILIGSLPIFTALVLSTFVSFLIPKKAW